MRTDITGTNTNNYWDVLVIKYRYSSWEIVWREEPLAMVQIGFHMKVSMPPLLQLQLLFSFSFKSKFSIRVEINRIRISPPTLGKSGFWFVPYKKKSGLGYGLILYIKNDIDIFFHFQHDLNVINIFLFSSTKVQFFEDWAKTCTPPPPN